jgi:hypothetical protein
MNATFEFPTGTLSNRPETGTRVLHGIGVEYGDLSYLAWAYEQEVPRAGFAWGYAAATAPPPPWSNREAALRRNQEMQHLWEQKRKLVGMPKAP